MRAQIRGAECFDIWIYKLGRVRSLAQRHRAKLINATASIRNARATVAAMLQRSNFTLAPQFA